MPTRHTHSLSFLLIDLVKFLLLEGGWLAEGKDDGVGGQLSVSVGHSIKTVSDVFFIEWVEEDGFGALSVDCHAGLAASDAAW